MTRPATRETVAQIIRECRTRRGLNQKDLAKRIRVTPATVSNYETGRASVSSEMLFKIMTALDYMVVFRPVETEQKKYYKKIKQEAKDAK